MCKCVLVFLLCLCLSVAHPCYGQTGLGLILTKSGFEEISKIAEEIAGLAPSIEIPDVGPFQLKEKHKVIDYDLNVSLNRIKINALNLSKFSILPSDKSGLSVVLKVTTNLQTEAIIIGKMVVALVPIHVSAKPTVLLDIVNLDCSISFKLKRNATGDLELETDSLESEISIGKLGIKFEGDSPETWLLNIIDLLASWGKNLIAKKFQNNLPSFIKQILSSVDLRLYLEIENYSNVIDLRLVLDPIYTDSYIELQCNGTVSLPRNNAIYPHSPAPFPALPTNLNNMLYVYVSNYTINSALWSYFTVGLFKLTVSPYTLKPSSLTDKILHLLNTNFYEYILPPLYRYYPNKNLTINVSASSAPSLAFYDDVTGVSLNFTLNIQVNESNRFIPVMRLNLATAITSNIHIADYEGSLYIELKVLGFHHNLHLLSVNPILGNMNSVFEKINKLLYDPFFVNLMNKLFLKGYNLMPILNQLPFGIDSPNIQVLKGFMLVDTSFKLKSVLSPNTKHQTLSL